ncbi:hypothetical protein PVAP13_3NG235326 [Panicum virgatum]|uniref:GRF-type domain-containing protein n=1 Tax=Panicum virgatum TaxID=38727 RepID=A0A8T0UF23_PANVG|nr:hypothetical protein PVAP13_3NG235326 [Panicum virgatum]
MATSRSSRNSSTSSRAWSGYNIEDYSSPIPYRERPLEYEPAVNCKCGAKAARWISWSDENPGRRYLKCFFARAGGCDFWRWYENNMTTPFIAQLLRDLRDAVRSLKKEKKEMEEGFATAQNAAENALQGQYEQIGHLNRLLAEKEAANAELKTTVEMLQKERVVLRLVIGVCIAVVVALICRK